MTMWRHFIIKIVVILLSDANMNPLRLLMPVVDSRSHGKGLWLWGPKPNLISSCKVSSFTNVRLLLSHSHMPHHTWQIFKLNTWTTWIMWREVCVAIELHTWANLALIPWRSWGSTIKPIGNMRSSSSSYKPLQRTFFHQCETLGPLHSHKYPNEVVGNWR